MHEWIIIFVWLRVILILIFEIQVVILFIKQKKNMCVYGHPTDPNFC